VDADRIVRKAPLDLVGWVIETDLIILRGQGIDVILGMSWMKWHKAILDIAAQLIQLNSPVHGKVTLYLPRTESFGNSSVSTFSLLVFTLVQNYNFASEIAMENGCYLL
jgi:hypothetical protein